MKIRCMIVDDEPFAVKLLEEYIGQISWLTLTAKCYNAIEALETIKQKPVDLIFLDINMPQLTGMQLTSLLPTGQKFIFTTAYSEFAVESYEKNAIDYLLKPITLDRFVRSVNKAASHFQKPLAEASDDRIFLKTGKTFVQLGFDEIQLIEGLKDYVIFHTKSGKHIVYKRMKELEETLPLQFSRIHNSYIINRDHMQKLEENHVWIADHRVPVSEKYRMAFQRIVQGRIL